MIVFPNCKINLGLQVLRKRNDGFHDISSIFYPVPLRDALEIITRPDLDTPLLHNYGMPVNGAAGDNLCVKAWQLLKEHHPAMPAVEIHLLKNIPMGAGLGGGSADAAFMLQLLNHTFRLAIPDDLLRGYALQLGSDCPFFIINKPCIGGGRGELLSPVELSLAGYRLVLVFPGIHINTGWAFGALSLHNQHIDLATAIQLPVDQWKGQLKNDFEAPVFTKYPDLAKMLKQLYHAGAVYASMSGSGSTLFGLFAPGVHPDEKALPANSQMLVL